MEPPHTNGPNETYEEYMSDPTKTTTDNDLPTDETGKLLYAFKPFMVQGLTNLGDIPEKYAVYELPDDGAVLYGGCIIYGKYNGKWVANVSARALVTHLLSEIEKKGVRP